MITIITDSTAYFSEEEAKKLGIVSVPMIYKVKDHEFYENYREKNGDYISLINSNKNNIITEQTSVSFFQNAFKQLINDGKKVLCILISSRLSGSYHNACIASKDFGEENVIIIDSLFTAGGLRLLVEKACEIAEKTSGLKELAAKVEEYRKNISIIFSVDSIEPIKKSGRLGFVRQSIGSALNIKPLLKCEDGTVVSMGTSRGFQDRIKKIISSIPEHAEKIIVNCNDDVKNMWEFKSAIEEKFKSISIEYSSIGPVLLIHLGKGVLAVSWITE